MPAGPTWDEAWNRMLEFRYRSSGQFEKALAAHIRPLNPKATVDFNYHGNPPVSFEVGQRPVQHAGNGDFNTATMLKHENRRIEVTVHDVHEVVVVTY